MLHIISCPRLAIIQTQSYKNRENTGNKESKTSLSEKNINILKVMTAVLSG